MRGGGEGSAQRYVGGAGSPEAVRHRGAAKEQVWTAPCPCPPASSHALNRKEGTVRTRRRRAKDTASAKQVKPLPPTRLLPLPLLGVYVSSSF
ncbi:hypothetical protein NDU88_004668 [Pleurodeles waltl]|uniref:Uncharacterized protein n=1 Tax=Pleurodeles waltl TaxID=8319 RepID=A0AAV7W8T7_PLEWA|nr:hypothetical protein NDU88_004668 [Pleurodeles waltl]